MGTWVFIVQVLQFFWIFQFFLSKLLTNSEVLFCLLNKNNIFKNMMSRKKFKPTITAMMPWKRYSLVYWYLILILKYLIDFFLGEQFSNFYPKPPKWPTSSNNSIYNLHQEIISNMENSEERKIFIITLLDRNKLET